MRYRGQGHEIGVPLSGSLLDPVALRAAFDASYTRLFGRVIPGLEVEAVTWTLALSQPHALPSAEPPATPGAAATPNGHRRMVDPATGSEEQAAVFDRANLQQGNWLTGPAVVTEDGTSTIVPSGYTVCVAQSEALVITADGATQ
jgi:N-methylhydantoinase A